MADVDTPLLVGKHNPSDDGEKGVGGTGSPGGRSPADALRERRRHACCCGDGWNKAGHCLTCTPYAEKMREMSCAHSLDYELPDSAVIHRKLVERTRKHHRLMSLARNGVCLVVGALVAATYYLVHWGSEKLSDYKWERVYDEIFEGNQAAAYFVIMGISLAMALTGAVAVLFEPSAAGSGIPEVLGFLNGSMLNRPLSLKTLVVKVFGLILAVSSGLAIGPEGPMIFAGSTLAIVLIRTFRTLEWRRLGATLFRRRQGATIETTTSVHSESQVYTVNNDQDLRVFSLAGAAAGVAAAFHAPIGGVVFGFEEAMSFFHPNLVFRTFVTSTCAYWVISLMVQGKKLDSSNFRALDVGNAVCDTSYSWQDFLFFTAIGVITGLVSAVFNACVVKLNELRARHLNSRPLARLLEVTLVVTITCTVVIYMPTATGDFCRPRSRVLDHLERFQKTIYNVSATEIDIQPKACMPEAAETAWDDYIVKKIVENAVYTPEPFALYNFTLMARALQLEGLRTDWPGCQSPWDYNELASLLQVTGPTAVKNLFARGMYELFSIHGLVVFGLIYFVLSVISAGICLPAGLVVPMLAIGGVIGRISGIVVNRYIKDPLHHSLCDPGVYAVIGAAGMWSGSTRITLTVAVVIAEVTGDLSYVPAICVSAIAAKWTADRFGHSLYHRLLHLKNIPFLEHKPKKHMYSVSLAESVLLGKPAVRVLCRGDSVRRILRLLRTTSHNGFPVVDCEESAAPSAPPRLCGLILRSQLNALLEDLGVSPPATPEAASSQRRAAAAEGKAAGAEPGNGLSAPARDLDSFAAACPSPAPERTSKRLDSVSSAGSQYGASAAPATAAPTPYDVADAGDEFEDISDVHLDLSSFMHRTPYTVRPEFPLYRAFELFRQMGLRHLTVVDADRHVVGIVTRVDLVNASHAH